jgi:hypothetical protein
MKLSVIIPTYNRAALVGFSVETICKVTHRPLEIVIVDDGSTDDTPAREPGIHQFCEMNGVECKWMRQRNSGAATARNTGFAASNGQLVMWVDADDTVDFDGVYKLIQELIKAPALDVAYGLVRVVSPKGVTEGVMGKEPLWDERDFFDYLWHTMGAVYRRSCIITPGPWNPVLTMPDDWDFSCRLRIAGVRYQFFDLIAGNYQKYETGTLTTTGFNERKCFNVIEAVLSIHEALVAAGKLSPYLQQRCYNRVLVHAVELSSHGSALAKQAYSTCRDIGSPSRALALLADVLCVVPIRPLHRLVFRILRSK